MAVRRNINRAQRVLGGGGVAKKGRGGTQSGGNVLHVSNTGGTNLWIRDLGTLCGNGEDGGLDTHRVSDSDHKEVGAVEVRRDMGDSQGGSS